MVPDHRPGRAVTAALFDPHEGNLDPNGATYAYADAAQQARRRGGPAQPRRSPSRRPDRRLAARHRTRPDRCRARVNAGGLWARKVGRMVGVDHPLVPMQHHYLVTEDVPEVAAIDGDMPAVTDLEGFTYLQREGNGVLLGVYEQNPRHWMVGRARRGTSGMDAVPRGGRADRARAHDRVQALPRAEGRRHQAVGERRVHVHARRQPAGRAGRRAPRLLGGVRRDGGLLAGRRHRPRARELDRRRRSRATTSSAWTSPVSGRTRRTTATCATRRRSSTRAASSWRTRTRSSPAGRPLQDDPPATTRSPAAGAHFDA